MKEKTAKILKEVIFWIIYIILMWVSIMIQVGYHENAHQQIFYSFNIDSNIDYSIFGGGETLANIKDYQKYCNEKCVELQEWNEIIGYNVMSLTYTAWLLGAAIIIYNKFNKTKK